MYNDTSVVNDECGSIRQLSGAVADNTGAINSNFDAIDGKLKQIEAFLNSFYSDGKFDFDGKCATNLGSCCTDPTSALNRDDIDKRIPIFVQSAVANAIGRISEHSRMFGSEATADFMLPVIDSQCNQKEIKEVVQVVYAEPLCNDLPIAKAGCDSLPIVTTGCNT